MPKAEPSPSTLWTPEAMKPQEITTSSTPCPRSHSSMNAMNGRSTSGTTGLGTGEVNGRRRVPSPPARIRACISGPLAPPDAFVGEPGRGDRGAVERVASVDDEAAGHAGGGGVPVEFTELGPFGHEHDRVGAIERRERRVGEVDARHQPARLLLRDRVICAHR